MEEAVILIDAGYLSFISKFFGKGKPLKFRIEKFVQNLVKEKNLLCKDIYYYVAPPYQSPKPTKQENERKSKYDKFVQKLKSAIPPIIVKEGRCQRDNKGIYHQKGVDTLLTMDLLKIAQKNNIKTAIIITSDTDFVPVIEDVIKTHGIRVILAYFTDKKRRSAFSLSNHLWNACSEKILIREEHLVG